MEEEYLTTSLEEPTIGASFTSARKGNDSGYLHLLVASAHLRHILPR